LASASTIAAFGSAARLAGGTSNFRSRDPPPTITCATSITLASIQIGNVGGNPYGVTPPISMPVIWRVSSAEANDAFLTPNRLRTTPLTSSRVVASTRQAAYTRGSVLPTTTMALAD
jgi:hypothetical protein